MDEHRRPRIEGNVVVIPLTMGKTAFVDVADFNVVKDFTWTCAKRGDLFYGYRQQWLGGGAMRSIMLHRAVLNPESGVFVDHIDRDGLNNRRSNLRLCTHTENMRNRKRHKNNKSGYKGVKQTASGRFEAGIRVDKKYHYLGLFDNPKDAHDAYVDASGKLHLDFGRVS